MVSKRFKKKRKIKKESKKKIIKLFDKVTKKKDQKMATRIIRKARRLAMKFRISLKPYKHTYCKHCYKRLIPGKNARVRIHNSKIIYYCLECKKFRRIPLKSKKTIKE